MTNSECGDKYSAVNLQILDISIKEDNLWGERCIVVKPSNIYGARFGDDCFIGPFVEIQENSIIGHRVRIQSHTFICSQVTIGDDVFISHGVIFVNDKFSGGTRANGDYSKYSSTTIGNRVLIGSGSTILPVKICDDVTVGAGSVVTSNISSPGIYFGNPAKFYKGL